MSIIGVYCCTAWGQFSKLDSTYQVQKLERLGKNLILDLHKIADIST